MTQDFLLALPKTELHVHLEGCLEPHQALAFAQRNGIDFKHRTVEEIVEANRFSGLAEFVAVMQQNSMTICTEQDIYDVAFGYLRSAHEDNIVHAELAFSPQGAAQRGVPYEAVFDGVIAAYRDARRDFGMTGGPILACLRHRPPEEALHMLNTYGPNYRDDILAIGLHGAENGFAPAPFKVCFELARSFGWHAVAHAGEEGPVDYIHQALRELRVERIDHGVGCEADKNLVGELAERGIPLTVCPLSNIHLKVFDSLENHNFLRLLDKGLNVSLHTDDPSYFDGYLSNHYRLLMERRLLDFDTLAAVQENAFRSAFMPQEVKARYIAQSNQIINVVRNQAP